MVVNVTANFLAGRACKARPAFLIEAQSDAAARESTDTYLRDDSNADSSMQTTPNH